MFVDDFPKAGGVFMNRAIPDWQTGGLTVPSVVRSRWGKPSGARAAVRGRKKMETITAVPRPTFHLPNTPRSCRHDFVPMILYRMRSGSGRPRYGRHGPAPQVHGRHPLARTPCNWASVCGRLTVPENQEERMMGRTPRPRRRRNVLDEAMKLKIVALMCNDVISERYLEALHNGPIVTEK